MKRFIPLLALALTLSGNSANAAFWDKKPEWAMNATIIEACSCPMFCPCYFNSKPTEHHNHGKGKHFCKFNNAFRVNKGHYKTAALDGLKFWVSGDLGGDLTAAQFDWAVVTFDKGTTQEQKDAVTTILGHVYPVKWKSMTTAEGSIDTWEAKDGMARAAIDGGKTAEVVLKNDLAPKEAATIDNLPYWGVPRNTGFVLMKNEVEAYRVGPKAFEYKGTNGFMITIDINAKDVAQATPPAKAE